MGTHDTETENFFKGENVFGRRDISPNDSRSNDIWPKWSTDVVTVLCGKDGGTRVVQVVNHLLYNDL